MSISALSLSAVPMNDKPTGNPETNPAGTVIFAYPETAANVELLMPNAISPFT